MTGRIRPVALRWVIECAFSEPQTLSTTSHICYSHRYAASASSSGPLAPGYYGTPTFQQHSNSIGTQSQFAGIRIKASISLPVTVTGRTVVSLAHLAFKVQLNHGDFLGFYTPVAHIVAIIESSAIKTDRLASGRYVQFAILS